MRYEITKTCAIDTPNGTKPFGAGDVITEADILPGSLESGLRTGWIRPLAEPPTPPIQAAPAANHNTKKK